MIFLMDILLQFISIQITNISKFKNIFKKKKVFFSVHSLFRLSLYSSECSNYKVWIDRSISMLQEI